MLKIDLFSSTMSTWHHNTKKGETTISHIFYVVRRWSEKPPPIKNSFFIKTWSWNYSRMFDLCPTRFVLVLGPISSVFWSIGKSSNSEEKFSNVRKAPLMQEQKNFTKKCLCNFFRIFEECPKMFVLTLRIIFVWKVSGVQ